MTMKKDDNTIKNCLVSELSNMVFEFEIGRLTEEDIYSYFSSFLLDSNIDSKIVVDVLESEAFGEKGKEAAINIKKSEGW